MEAEKKAYLCAIVEADFMAGNESRIAYAEAMDDNAFVIHFQANSAEGLKGIKLKAGYQYNGETKDWTEEKRDEDSLLPTAIVYHKDIFVKMTGAKRGKTLLDVNKAFETENYTITVDKEEKKEETESAHEEGRVDDSVSASPIVENEPKEDENRKEEVIEEEDFHFDIPDELLDHGDDGKKNEHTEERKEEVKEESRPRDVEEMPVVKPSLGEDYEEKPVKAEEKVGNIKADEADEEKHEAAKKDEKKHTVADTATEGDGDGKDENENARGFVLDFIVAIGKVKKYVELASVLAKMTESQWKVIQILIKTGAVKFSEWVNKALYENAKARKWGIVARVAAPTYKDLKDGVSGTCEDADDDKKASVTATVDAQKQAEEKKTAVSVEQKPDVTVRTNFEDEDHEGLNPHGRIVDLKRTLSRCSGFLTRSSVSISPDGDFEERW